MENILILTKTEFKNRVRLEREEYAKKLQRVSDNLFYTEIDIKNKKNIVQQKLEKLFYSGRDDAVWFDEMKYWIVIKALFELKLYSIELKIERHKGRIDEYIELIANRDVFEKNPGILYFELARGIKATHYVFENENISKY